MCDQHGSGQHHRAGHVERNATEGPSNRHSIPLSEALPGSLGEDAAELFAGVPALPVIHLWNFNS